MFVRIKRSKNSPKCAVQIVESYRVNGKVRQKIIKHMGTAMEGEELDALKALANATKTTLEQEGMLPLFTQEPSAQQISSASPASSTDNDEALQVNLRDIVEERRITKGIHDIYGKLYDELGFHTLIPNPARNKRARRALKEITLARIAHPQSKRATVKELGSAYGVDLDLKLVYRMMDKITETTILKLNTMVHLQSASLIQKPIDVIYFDATTLYFESFSEDEFKRNGYSKDGKFNQPQVVLALMVTSEGLPVGYKAFSGDTFDGHTLIPVLKEVKEHYKLRNVIYVADAGMFNKDNLAELETLEGEQITYIVGARIKNLPKRLKEQILDLDNYHPINEDTKVATFEYQGRRLLVSHSKKREAKDAYERRKGIQRLRDRLAKSPSLKGQLSNQGYRKYLQISTATTDGRKACEPTLTLDEAKIEADAAWDGLKGIVTNDTALSPEEILHQYSNLWQVEESFRITKHDLKIRPIFHWKPHRVQAHLAIAFMAYTLVRHLEYRVRHQYKKLSPERIRTALLGVQESRLLETQTKRRFALPSAVSVDAEKIYKLIGVPLQRKPYEVT